ncbi:MAG: hypothetical protein IJL32_10445 [Oscillospiraceae bacterium]|nr:hypothetical protein [Oscillospiraceae bacterium]
MTESAFENLLRSIHLPFGELLPDGSTYRVTANDFIHLTDKQRNDLVTLDKFLIVTDKGTKIVGGVLFYGDYDIQITIFPEYRNRHFMSRIHKNGILKAECYPNQRVTLVPNAIDSFDDFKKKHYLLSCIQLRAANIEEVFKHLSFWKYPGIEKYTKESFIAEFS